jgi:predicted nuclease of predicted toxin-antitoxin system
VAALRVKLDENVARDAGALLRDAGHDVHTVQAERLAGAPDAKIFDACLRENRVLLTLDLDFADVSSTRRQARRGLSCCVRQCRRSSPNSP